MELTASLTKSLYFMSPDGATYRGKRFAAGQVVQVRETRRGLKAIVRDGLETYYRVVTDADLNKNL